MQRENPFGQPIGHPIEGWQAARRPERAPIAGRLCRLEPLDAERHADALHHAYSLDHDARHWTYLPYGPFASSAEYRAWVAEHQASENDCFFAIVEAAREIPVGVAAYLRVSPASGSIEVGHLRYAAALQRTPAATEAMYLMMRRVFDDWAYRRYEWKCDSLNAPSRSAAERLGFRYEGVFRNDVVMKGRNRDTAWFSITAEEWPAIRRAFEAWLDPANFDREGRDRAGRQRRRLREWMPATAGSPIVSDLPADP